jgi:hypothetical protein
MDLAKRIAPGTVPKIAQQPIIYHRLRILFESSVSSIDHDPRIVTNSSQDAPTMLTEPDMQARYVAATLDVIETELRNPDASARNRRALSALVASASRTAARLADDLERLTGAVARPTPEILDRHDNVADFRRRK